jgi:L-fucose isomerase-like protein
MTTSDKIRTNNEYIPGIAWAAHRGASRDTDARAEELMNSLLLPGQFRMTDRQPDIILFMSGGSERRALELADPERPVLLLSIRGNNAYAAATEVMAWMVNNGRVAVLSDALDAYESGLIRNWQRVAGAMQGLSGTRAGLLGTVSEWLVASDVSAVTLRDRFGIELCGIPWNGLPDYSREDPDPALMARFSGQPAEGIDDAARVLSLLRKAMSLDRLQAIAVECFSLVQQRKVTACLALAQLNAEGIVAACEGDTASMAGMAVGKALTGRVPWMANTTRLTEKTLILSHCTAPFDFVGKVELPAHYETGYSLAVEGEVSMTDVTIYRFSEQLDRAFVTEGRVVGRPRLADACRTQVEISLPREALHLLREKPLGNHLLVSAGMHSELLRLACQYKGIAILGEPA